MRRVLLAVVESLLGFLALAFFAFLAFASPNPTDERLLLAFKAATPVAVAELAFLWWRPTPANRLILGANLWLVAGGLAAWMQVRRGDSGHRASWLNRLLRRVVQRQATSATRARDSLFSG
jgi:hypothetical protein